MNNVKYDDILDIDETDKKIIELLQIDPEITHTEIAEKVHKSQPAVGARIIKLKRKHLLTPAIGSEFSKLELKLARIDVAVKNAEEMWAKFTRCPYVVNCFKMTGEYNMSLEVVAPNLKTIDQFIDNCLRKEDGITSIRSNFIIDTLRKYVVPLSFAIEKYENHGCGLECQGKLTREELKSILSSES